MGADKGKDPTESFGRRPHENGTMGFTNKLLLCNFTEGLRLVIEVMLCQRTLHLIYRHENETSVYSILRFGTGLTYRKMANKRLAALIHSGDLR
jgi:hypothetical protein